MRLQPAAFNAFLGGNIGQRLLWRRASICPCINPLSGAANPKCPKCSGKGRIWGEPVEATAGVTQQKIDKTWAMLGRYETGDATLTVPESSPLYEAGEFDRVTLLNSTDRFDMVLQHGAPVERLFFKVVKLDRVFWYTGPNDGTGTLVEGALPAVDDSGVITWGDGAPPVGKQYSLSGVKYDEYFLINGMPSDRGEHFGARLPKKMIARAFDLFSRHQA